MTSLTVNPNTFGATLSPYHPSNLTKFRNLQVLMNKQKTDVRKHYAVVENINDIEDDWRRIEPELHVSIHQSFAWCRAWIDNKNVKPLFIVGYLEGRIEFILPLEISSHFGVKTARLIGHNHSNLNFALCSSLFLATCDKNFVQQLQADIKKLGTTIDVLILDRMRLQLKTAPNPFAAILNTKNQNASFQLPLLDSFDETLSQINRKRKRKKFRGTERKLNEAGGFTHTIANSTIENERIISAFFEQKAIRLKNQGLPNVFADAQLQAFFDEVCALPNEEMGSMELHAIVMNGKQHGGKVLAIAAVTSKRDHAICQFSSFDEELSRELDCSPGEFLFFLAIENFNDRGFRVFDFGIGDQTYKRSWCTQRSEHFDGTIAFNMFGELYARMVRLKTDLKRKIKSSERLYAIAAKIRSIGA